MKKLFSIILFCSFAVYATAQKTGDLGHEEITVVKSYKPTLSDAFKISDIPERDTSSAKVPVFDYVVLPKKMDVDFKPTPIKPVKVKDENIKKLYHGLAKGGYGTNNTPYGEVWFSSLRSKSFTAGIHAKHFSSTGKIKGFGFPGFSENAIDVNGKKFFEHTSLSGKIGYKRNAFHFYGYKSPPELFTKKVTLHTFNDVWGDFSFATYEQTNSDELFYDFGIGFYNFSDNLKATESNYALHAKIGKEVLSGTAWINTKLDLNTLDQPLTDIDYNIVSLEPRYRIKEKDFTLTAGANFFVETFNKTKMHWYPSAELEYRLIKGQLIAFGFLTGALEKNFYKSFLNENPFVVPPVGLAHTNKKLDAGGGLRARISHEVQAVASASFKRMNDVPFYVNTYTPESFQQFSILYDDASLFNVHGEVAYQANDKTEFAIKTDYFGWNPDDEEKAWHKEPWMLTFAGSYNIANKIFVRTDWFVNGPRYAKAYGTETSAQLKSRVDANLGVDYKYSKNLSAFVKLTNITASRYYLWQNYPSYRLNALAGVSYSF